MERLSAGAWNARDGRQQIIALTAVMLRQLQGIILMTAAIIHIINISVDVVDSASSSASRRRLDHHQSMITIHEHNMEEVSPSTYYPIPSHDHDVDHHNYSRRPQQPQLHDRHALLLLEKFRSLTDQAVESIQSSDGDVIDCVPLEKQLAFQHPLLKGHKIQRFPSYFPSKAQRTRSKKSKKRKAVRIPVVTQVWHEAKRTNTSSSSNGQRKYYCPAGSIPVRRTSESDIQRWAAESIVLETSASQKKKKKKDSHARKTGDGQRRHGHARYDHDARPSAASSSSPLRNRVVYGTKTHMPPRPPDSSNSSQYSSSSATHEHAIAYYVADDTDDDGRIYGASAVVSVWEPWVEAPDEFSLSQIWLLAGSFDGQDLNSIEAGWQVSPELYGDGNPRLFTYWTTDGYASTGCYNLLCSGFVQVSESVAMGASIAPVSRYGGSQFQIEIMIWKDPREGNWWMAFEGTHVVGYWPAELFSHLSNHATMVEFGGEVVNSSPDGRHTATQMGSGHFPGQGFGYAAFFHSLQVVDSSNNLQGITHLETMAEDGGCYDIRSIIHEDPEWGTAFYFGGPGHNALCP